MTVAVAGSFAFVSAVEAQPQSQFSRIEALKLDVQQVGRVTTYFAPEDRRRAAQLTMLAEDAAAFFERELGLSFSFRLAALAPKHWFSPYGSNLPYGIPWSSVAERLIVVPSSSNEAALIQGQDSSFNERMIDFVTLHEFGHIANKQFYHPTSSQEELPIPWFEELLASYVAYAFMSRIDPKWTELARGAWSANVSGYTPRIISLDWSFMRSLPGPELGRTYGWYQLVLNLRAAETYAQHGVAFLPKLKATLPFDNLSAWTTELLLTRLDTLAPGFQAWAADLQGRTKRPEKK